MNIELPAKFTLFFLFSVAVYVLGFIVTIFSFIIPCLVYGIAGNILFILYLVLTFLPMPFVWYYLRNDFEEEWKPRIISCIVMLVCSAILYKDIVIYKLFF